MKAYLEIEMPKSCAKCKLFGEYGCPFIGAVGNALTRGERNEDCPLVPIPEHGRLIDRDAISLEDGPYECDERCEWMLEQYLDAPTVIPASEEGDRMSNCIHLYCKQGADAIERLNAFNLMWQEAVKINEQAEKEEA